MALIFCRNCGAQISEFADSCVKCDFKLPARLNQGIPSTSFATNNDNNENLVTTIPADTNTTKAIFGGVIAILLLLFITYVNDKGDHRNQSASYTEGQTQVPNDKTTDYNICGICGKKFTGKGYEEVSDGVWQPCKEPYQCYICSPACGRQSTRNMENVLKRHGINPSIIHDSRSHDSYSSNTQKVCSVCKGTGTEICGMCDGSGINNMGIECGCLSYNKNMILMGRETSPYHGPIHACIRCKGTGYEQ